MEPISPRDHGLSSNRSMLGLSSLLKALVVVALLGVGLHLLYH